MSKKNKGLFLLLTEAIGLYFSNFIQFFKYMSFPIWGQFFGILIILFCTIIYSKNIPTLLMKCPVLDNWNCLIFLSIIITIPGLIIFLKAFWEYLVAYGAINSMVENAVKSGKVYDFNAHTELIKRRTPAFIWIWLLISTLSLFALCPFFTIICAIFGIYFILVFQIFTFESDKSAIGCFKRSFELIKGHFASTFLLLILVCLVTYIFLPQIFTKLLEITKIYNFLIPSLSPLVSVLPVIDLQQFSIKISEKFILEALISQLIIQYTLPLRSILWSLWYKELNHKMSGATRTETKKKKKAKRPSEKLMEVSRKKYSKTKIDNNILRRAMEKDE